MIMGQSKTYSMMGWAAVAIWFSASLLSQIAYIGTHGVPYEATNLLSTIGPWSWILLTVELGVWMMAGVLVLQRLSSGGARAVFPTE